MKTAKKPEWNRNKPTIENTNSSKMRIIKFNDIPEEHLLPDIDHELDYPHRETETVIIHLDYCQIDGNSPTVLLFTDQIPKQ